MTTKILLYLGIALSILCASMETAAQGKVALATRKAELQALSTQLKRRDEHDHRQVQQIARQLGIPLRRKLPNDGVLELQRFILGRGPTFYLTYNVDAADSVSTDELYPGRSAGLSLYGSGMTVGEWDGGAIAEHPDFILRLTQMDVPTEISDHSTHVAGTLVGSGEGNPPARGMAFDADLHAYDWNSDSSEMALAASNGLLLSNHSYGIAAGWISIGDLAPDNWWWIGGENNTEDANFGYYDTETQLWDQIAFDAPYYLIVKAAGNDRWDIGPEPGEFYRVVDQDGASLSVTNQARPADCAQAGGYDCLPTASVAKNILTVGAVHDVLGGYLPLAGPSSVQMTGFSDWGPTDDGRIKPDLVGNGWLLLSTYGQNPYYAPAVGTSMAAPNVTGSLLLLQQHYQNIHGSGMFMRAATLKALAIHTADETGTANGPDYEYGWGLLNTKRAARLITDDSIPGGDYQIIEASLLNSDTNTVPITVDVANSTISVTIVWTDPPGTPVAPSLDPTDLMLVNDLDLRLTSGASTYLPWVLNPASPTAPASKGDNFRDNVEQVVIEGAAIGSYFIEVSHKGTLLSPAGQDYSLIVSVGPPPAVSTGFIIDEDFSGGMPPGWSVETTMGIDWTINSPVPADARLDNLTGGAGMFAMVDNGYSNQTITSLRTATLDLSSTESAVLSFDSFFYYDTLESINVDVSIDGGANWTNVWQHMGFSNISAHHVLDLSAALAGQPSVALRFLFDSENEKQGEFWQIDNVQLEAFGNPPPPPPVEGNPPGQASNPTPANTAFDLGIDTALSWTAGQLSTSHAVYFGTSSTPALQMNQAGTTFNPGTLAANTLYFWRIDESNNDGTTPGITWNFTTGTPPEAGTMHVGDLDASRIEQPRKRWQATATIVIHDEAELPLADALVAGVWSNGASGSDACTTNGSGQCAVSMGNLKSNIGSVSFTVSSVSHSAGHLYVSGNNHDPDGDSNNSTIDIAQQPGTGNTAPTATINSPPDSANFDSGTVISFSGSAADNEEGDLSANLAWSSSINGSIGTGGSFSSSALSDGSHTISASITDSQGASDTVSVTITVGNAPPVLAHVANLTGSTAAGRRNRWNAEVTVAVTDAVDQAVMGAVVDGSWGSGATGSGSCTTDSQGLCTIAKNNIKSAVTSIGFTVDNISGPGITYDPGTSITSIELSNPL